MLIQLAYEFNGLTEFRYFDNFKEVESFIIGYLRLGGNDFVCFDLIIYRGKEEERVRSIREREKKNDRN